MTVNEPDRTIRTRNIPCRRGGAYGFIQGSDQLSPAEFLLQADSAEPAGRDPLQQLDAGVYMTSEAQTPHTLIHPCTRHSRPTGEHVLYFGPGHHQPEGGIVHLRSGQILFLDEGCILEAAVSAHHAEHIHICGRGIIDGSRWTWKQGPAPYLLHVHDCHDIVIEGITIQSSWYWTLVMVSSEEVTVRDLRILNGRCENDDGINICNSRKVRISDCFIHTDDDCISIKGLPPDVTERYGYPYPAPPEKDKAPVEQIRVDQCTLWSDRAHGIMVGPECRAERMDDLAFSHCRIISSHLHPVAVTAGEECPVSELTFEHFHVQQYETRELIRLETAASGWMTDEVPGYLDQVLLRDWQVDPDREPRFYLASADERHLTQHIHMERLSYSQPPISWPEQRVELAPLPAQQ